MQAKPRKMLCAMLTCFAWTLSVDYPRRQRLYNINGTSTMNLIRFPFLYRVSKRHTGNVITLSLTRAVYLARYSISGVTHCLPTRYTSLLSSRNVITAAHVFSFFHIRVILINDVRDRIHICVKGCTKLKIPHVEGLFIPRLMLRFPPILAVN